MVDEIIKSLQENRDSLESDPELLDRLSKHVQVVIESAGRRRLMARRRTIQNV